VSDESVRRHTRESEKDEEPLPSLKERGERERGMERERELFVTPYYYPSFGAQVSEITAT